MSADQEQTEGCQHRVLDKYKDIKLCDMAAEDREEFLCSIAQRGATDALRAVGLSDERAGKDIEDLRSMLKGFRVIRKGAWHSALGAFGRMIGWVITFYFVSLVLGHSQMAKDVLKLVTSGG